MTDKYETEERFLDEFTTLVARDMAHACLYTGEGQNVKYYVRWTPINPVQVDAIYPDIHELFEKEKEELIYVEDKKSVYIYQMEKWNLLEHSTIYELVMRKYNDCLNEIRKFIDTHFDIEDQVFVNPGGP